MIKGTKNHLVFGIIKKLFVYIFKFIYIFVKFLNLQPAVLIGLIGLVLYLTGKLDGTGGALQTIFYILLIFSLFYSIVKTIKSILFPNRNKEKNNDRKVESTYKKEETEENTTVPPVVKVNETVVPPVQPVPPTTTAVPPASEVKVETASKVSPVYYAVKQNPNYIMAEFPDRYELYLKTQNGLVKVRTDAKV